MFMLRNDARKPKLLTDGCTQGTFMPMDRSGRNAFRLIAHPVFRMKQEDASCQIPSMRNRRLHFTAWEEPDMERKLYINALDHERLTRLIEEANYGVAELDASFRVLQTELARATVVAPKALPGDVISMRSRIRITLDGTDMVVSLVYPDEANRTQGKLSVLSPIGTAIIGYRAGDVIQWQTPGGLKRIEIKEVLYQPESAGEYEL